MKLQKVGMVLSKITGRTGLTIQKYSPEILLVVGVTGTVASAVLACRATLKADQVLFEHETKMSKIAQAEIEAETHPEEIVYTPKDIQKDKVIVYTQTAVEFIKLYGPAVSLGVASIFCIVSSHGIMKKRNVALMAAYKAIEEGFAAYRKRVVEEFGEEKDYIYKHGLKAEQISETEIGEDGKSHKVKKTQLVDSEGLGPYARYFDRSCDQWSESLDYNLMFLKGQQNIHNDLLKSRGHVFLNEVYDALGIPRSTEAAVVGWVLGNGDNYIDFGIFNEDKMKDRKVIRHDSEAILLDFNVDGTMWNKI